MSSFGLPLIEPFHRLHSTSLFLPFLRSPLFTRHSTPFPLPLHSYHRQVPPNTGVLAFQTTNQSASGFRISLTGNVLEQKATPTVMKKLKLVGHPYKVYKNTAFISGMFTSSLEVSKFEHAKIKTVSGIRGAIKKVR